MGQETVATLPPSARDAFKEPMGPVFTGVSELLVDDGLLVAVGDVVTYYLLRAGHPPDVALLDGRTEREAVEPDVADTLDELVPDVVVPNVPGTLSAELVEVLVGALRERERGGDTTVISVEGEEDLATLPAVLAAPEGATVVYGQPGEGMVRIRVDEAARERARDLLDELDTEERLHALLA